MPTSKSKTSTHSTAPASAANAAPSARAKSTLHRTPLLARPLFWAVLVAAILVGALITFAVLHTNSQSADTSNSDSATTATPDSPTDSADSSTTPASDTDSDAPAPEPDRVTQYEGDAPNELSELTGAIAANYVDSELNLVVITATIDQYLAAPGTCTLTITRGAYTFYTATATAAADVTTSGCGPFEIPLSVLPAGTYTINIQLSADGKTGLITSELVI